MTRFLSRFQQNARDYLRQHPSLLGLSDKEIARALKAAGVMSRNTYSGDCNIRDAVEAVKIELSAATAL